MERTIDIMLSSNSFFLLTGLLAAALFFLMATIREIVNDRYEGFLYLPVALFFGAAHGFYLAYIPIDSPMSMLVADLNVWTWIVYILAPALIVLFVVLGSFSLIRVNFTTAAVKIFFGLTLLLFVFMVGSGWAADTKGVITLLYAMAFFHIEWEAAT